MAAAAAAAAAAKPCFICGALPGTHICDKCKQGCCDICWVPTDEGVCVNCA